MNPEPQASDGELVVTRDGSVATLWLNRPAKRNAVTYEMWNGIAERCRSLAVDREVRLLVIRGTGGHFCAGADIEGLAHVDPADYQAANRAADDAISAFPKPTLAFITGACVGGGTEIAIACDLRLADRTARFGITPARLGILYPAFAVERAVALIGAAATKHLLYTAEIIDVDRAMRIGLVHEHHEPGESLDRLVQLTDLLAGQRSLMTQQATKAMIADIEHQGRVAPSTEASWAAELAASPDPAEGIVAFLERRSPRFTWSSDDGRTSRNS